MSYSDRLRRWAVFRLLEDMQRVTVVRCVNESDADGYVRVLQRLEPTSKFMVVFDPTDNCDPVEYQR